MQLHFVGRNIDITDALKNYVSDKLMNVDQRFSHLTSVSITLKVEKIRQIAEINVHINGVEIHASAESEDMYKSIDEMTDKLFTLLTKHKEKMIDQHHRPHD